MTTRFLLLLPLALVAMAAARADDAATKPDLPDNWKQPSF
jgi:hypothetical protein